MIYSSNTAYGFTLPLIITHLKTIHLPELVFKRLPKKHIILTFILNSQDCSTVTRFFVSFKYAYSDDKEVNALFKQIPLQTAEILMLTTFKRSRVARFFMF